MAVTRRLKNISLPILAMVFAIGLAVEAASPSLQVAGKVVEIKGSVIAVQNAQVRPLQVDDQVLIGDILSTGADSRLEIAMIDDSVFQLGALTSFVVIDYTFGQGNEDNAALNLLRGAVDGVSGQIAKLDNGNAMTINTQQATIGIRGTKFFIGELDEKIQIAHWSGGGLEIKNQAGTVFIEKDNHGVTLEDINIAPSQPVPWDGDKKKRAKALVN